MLKLEFDNAMCDSIKPATSLNAANITCYLSSVTCLLSPVTAQIFGDPCPGVRKSLRVQYITRGFNGNLRIRERGGHLVAALELGYAPLPPRDEAAEDPF